ncbi:MAG: adenylate/guanylate cyclase domain-containing protein [Thermoplasmata archaeon]
MATTRRLAAIMFTDTVGYTASTQADEGRSLELLRQQAELVRPLLAVHLGREIKSTGDGFLVEFDSALKATQCAMNLQRRIYERNAEGGFAPFRIRIGIHLGDVVQSGTDILGDAVNIAARIEPLADPGGVCISGAVYEQVRNKIPDRLEKMPPTALKGLELPMDIYRVVLPWTVNGRPTRDQDSSPPLDKSRIAVLPFVSMSPDPNDEYFADGLSEELIASLALIKGLQVIARTSVMNYKKKEKNVSEIGKELGVGTVVEGSVRKAGNRIRVTVQVIDVATEAHLWASKYDDNLDDVFAVQSDIAARVAASIPGSLSTSRAPVPALQETQDVQAYRYFLQGQALAWQREEEPLRQSLGFFERAVEKDPTFSRAYVGIAKCYIELSREGFIPWSEAIDRGRTAARRALSVDANSAEAHAVLAELSFMADDPFEVQEREARKAVELNPNLADAHIILGIIDATSGDLRPHVSHAETAYQLDPLSPRAIRFLGRAYFYAGREQDALDHWNRTLHLDPFSSHRGMTDYYIAKGQLEQAGAMVKEMERIAPTNEVTYLNRGYLSALTGDKSTANEMIAKLVATHKPGWIGAGYVGYVYLALGDSDKFFEYEFAAAKDHILPAVDLIYSPLYAEVRKDPRFKQLLESAGIRILPPA